MTTLRYQVDLTDAELREAWLAEERARRGLARRAIGPALIVFGLGTLASQSEPTARGIATFAILLGVFHIARPFLAVARALSERRRRGGSQAITVALDDDGIALTREGKTVRFPWKDVTAAGERATYVWYELRGMHRAPIPRRVIDDLEALRETLRAHTRWIA